MRNFLFLLIESNIHAINFHSEQGHSILHKKPFKYLKPANISLYSAFPYSVSTAMVILTIQCLAPHYTCESPFPMETGVNISPLDNVLKVDYTSHPW